MKKWFSKKQNIFFLFILGFVAFQQFPVWKNNISQTHKSIPSKEVTVISNNGVTLTQFPPTSSRAMAIFWASWCGPCKIEMNRLKKSVESGVIKKEQLFAINPFESDIEVKKFLKESDYPFTFVSNPSLAGELGISVTPTTIFIDKGLITKMTSGMSLWGIWEAEWYLK